MRLHVLHQLRTAQAGDYISHAQFEVIGLTWPLRAADVRACGIPAESGQVARSVMVNALADSILAGVCHQQD